ncbi:MAG TPA: hypothetical protein GXX17_01580 [Clostridiales bacterium]|nr:hypothetical protein [Clostridiales bacterium]
MKKILGTKRVPLILTTLWIALLLCMLFMAVSWANKIYPKNCGISHMLIGFPEARIDGTTHKVANCYIQDGCLYLEVLAAGQNNEPQATQSAGYTIRYKNRKYRPDLKDNTQKDSTYKFPMPHIGFNRDITLPLYYGDQYIADLYLKATDNILSDKSGILAAEKDGLLMFADINPNLKPDQQTYLTEMRLNAVLLEDTGHPLDADFNTYKSSFYWVYIEDYEGNKYFYRAHPMLSQVDLQKQRLQERHCYYFDLPRDLKEYRIVVPSITYKSGQNGMVILEGPWVIPVKKQE